MVLTYLKVKSPSAFVYFRWSWPWSCYFGLDLDLGHKNLVLFTSLDNGRRRSAGAYPLLLCFLDGRDLLGYNRQDLDVDTVEFVETGPSAGAVKCVYTTSHAHATKTNASYALVTSRRPFDCYSTAIRPRYDHSTTYLTTGLLHCNIDK